AEAATIYYRSMSDLVVFLMGLAAIALDVPETFFDDKVDRSIGTMRLNYYPAQTAAPSPGQLRASAHTDYGGFTNLSREDVRGGAGGGRRLAVATVTLSVVANLGFFPMGGNNPPRFSKPPRGGNPPPGKGPARPHPPPPFLNPPNSPPAVGFLPRGGPPEIPAG